MAGVLITGGASGLGKVLAVYFACSGFDVAVQYFSSDPSSVIKEIELCGAKGKAYWADLTKPDVSFFDQVEKDFPNLEIVVNNASVFTKTDYASMTTKDYEASHNIHLKNPLFVAQKFAKMPNAKSIINISDALANPAHLKYFTHSINKNFMLQMTHFLAQGLAPKIRVNAVCPSYIWDGSKDAIRVTNDTLLRQKITQTDVVSAVDYLVKSPFVTNQIMGVDGGGARAGNG